MFDRHFGADQIGVKSGKHVCFFLTEHFGCPKITYFQIVFERPKLHFSEPPLICIVIPPKKHFPPLPLALVTGWRVGGLAGWLGWLGWLGWRAGWVGWAGWLVGLAVWLA